MSDLEAINERLARIEEMIRNREKPFLSLEEAAEYTGIPKATLYGYVHERKIPYHKLNGRRLYFSVEDLNDYILNAENRTEAEDDFLNFKLPGE